MDSTNDATYDDPRLPTDLVSPSNIDSRLLTELVPTSNVDPGSLDIVEPDIYDNLGTNMDQILTLPESVHCINCGSNITNRRRHIPNLLEVQSVILQWIAPQLITDRSFLCHSCWSIALNVHRQMPRDSQMEEATTSSNPGRQRQICVSCRCSLLRLRSHLLNSNTERENMIRNVIIQWINPRQLTAPDRICHPCWQRADREASRTPGRDDRRRSHTQETIELPHIRRAADTANSCFYPGCESAQRLRIPMWLRLHLFTEYQYYIPKICRICDLHLLSGDFEIFRNMRETIHTFTAAHIEDFASFTKERKSIFDFNNIGEMPESFTRYWIGLTPQQFLHLKESLPGLPNIRNGILALAAYLMKIKTGDSNRRISTQLDVPLSTLNRQINKGRELLVQDFVHRNLGINHITRSDIAQRNLYIPNGIFGGSERKPIIIMDGTYLYIQKSTNYLYQKDTYSLHKYRNLMKPFLMVCTDGYIIDVLGPYPATTSDASIILREFNEESNQLRQYFQARDVFILDRGFRDCVSLLRECNYDVHFPASLQEGETQLSSLAANKSRTVTMCRWVVEAVNGIFKMSFKIFRNEFFNTAATHAMTDFKIAAALINKFHKRITDREDAVEILDIVNEKLYINNSLAESVSQNNLNRRRTQFFSINVVDNNIVFPRLSYSELVLLACGTYQIKQAKSYYAEHIRNDGSYIIEVCTDEVGTLLQGFPSVEDCLLLRGRIQSRHISRKIYFIYILYQNNMDGREAIRQYCCNCLVGPRTLGCCAHVMTVIWYLSWAKYENVLPPAQFLDNVLLTYEQE